MIETTIDVRTPDGVMGTRTFRPALHRAYPVVVFFMDGLGVRGTLVEMARRIASNGYFVALPDLFYRSGPYAPFDGARAFGDPAERERIMALVREVTPTRVRADTTALLDRLQAEATADTTRVGTVGYCLGGGPAISAAGWFPEQVRAAASYHGGHLATDAPDSPHLAASTARAQVYVAYAENDSSFPDAQREKLETTLSAAGVSHAMELYRAAHGFAVRDLPSYRQEAADRHWTTMLGLFREALA
jgi:carboxymethylenebutenolidase